MGCNPFDVLPCLSEITERSNEKSGYSCTGKIFDYTVNIFDSGISLKGSLCKSLFGDNLQTLKRRDALQAIEKLSDCLHLDIKAAKVTRLDISTIIPVKRPPADYYRYLGNKPYFVRLQSTPDTLYYNSHQRQMIFYDKGKEATDKDMQIPAILQNSNLLRYELRFTNRLKKQLKTDLTATILYDNVFYYSVIQKWYLDFKAIQKLKEQGFMIDNINTTKEAETALFAALLQEKGQSVIDEYLAELKAKNVFKDRQRYYELRQKLNTILQTPAGTKSELMQELDTFLYNIARYAR